MLYQTHISGVSVVYSDPIHIQYANGSKNEVYVLHRLQHILFFFPLSERIKFSEELLDKQYSFNYSSFVLMKQMALPLDNLIQLPC